MAPELLPPSNETPNVVNRRTVYGYLRAEEPDEIEIGLWRKEIAHFCEQAGYHLALIFVDRGVPHEQVARTGFTALLDVLELGTSYAVVVPTRAHLSEENQAVATLRRLIRRTASELILIAEESDDIKADSA